MQEDLISVIVPVYNVEKYLKQCLDSLLAQTYRNMEIIIVDDGASDLSGAICDEYARMHKKITLVHKENEGLGMARNTGLDLAKGDYVYFIDSDDYIVSDEVEYLYSSLKKYGVDVCLTGYKSVDDDGNVLRERIYPDYVYSGSRAKTEVLPRMLGSLPDGSDRIEMSVASQMYSMKPIKEHNIRFASERKMISEDLIFNMDYLQYANGACTVKRTGNYYRCNPLSLSHKYLEGRFEKSRFFYLEVKERLMEQGYNSEAFIRHTKTFFINIRGCIAQEARRGSPFLFRQKMEKIRHICKDKTVQEAIDIYPVNRLGVRQRLFLMLVERRFTLVLFLLFRGDSK